MKELHRRHCSVLFLLLFVTAAATAGAIPRPEHPKPQFHRDAWLNLNGQWNFAFDFDLVGVEQGRARDPSGFDKEITVPFCPESRLSGIEYKAFIPAVWYHRTFTVHDYDQNPKTFRERYASVAADGKDVFVRFPEISAPYEGQPYVVDEYGGTFWTKDHAGKEPAGDNRSRWGYGKSAEQVEELIGKLTLVLTDHPNIAGYCYTQLTDVEQEVNGLYTYDRKDRKLKFDTARLKEYFGAPAAIENSQD